MVKLFKRDAVGCIAFLLADDFGVDLSRAYVFVGERLCDGVYVDAVGCKQCSVGVAQTVEGDFLGDYQYV